MAKTIWVIRQVTYRARRDTMGFPTRVTEDILSCTSQVANLMGFYKNGDKAQAVCDKLNEQVYEPAEEELTSDLSLDIDLLARTVMTSGLASTVTYHAPLPVFKMSKTK